MCISFVLSWMRHSGSENFVSLVTFKKMAGATADYLAGVVDYLVWYAKDMEHIKYRPLYLDKIGGGQGSGQYTSIEGPNGTRRKATQAERESPPAGMRVFRLDNITSQSAGREKGEARRHGSRSSLKVGNSASTSSPYTCSLEPKPPPTSGAITRTRSSPIPSRIDRNRRTKCGTWVEVQTVSEPAR